MWTPLTLTPNISNYPFPTRFLMNPTHFHLNPVTIRPTQAPGITPPSSAPSHSTSTSALSVSSWGSSSAGPSTRNPTTTNVAGATSRKWSELGLYLDKPAKYSLSSMAFLEGEESILESINEECLEDVDMDDVEEGECEEQNENLELVEARGEDDKMAIQEPKDRNCRSKGKGKRKKKNKRGIPTCGITDINRFVIDTCRRLKEQKSYLVWNAVGCLGVGAISDLVKEVDAIQACGGQMTADGKRFRTGGGILWSILKTREPEAYKEIMTRGRELEKQFRQQRVRPVSEQNKEGSPQKTACASSDGTINQVLKESLQYSPLMRGEEIKECHSQGKRISVLNRIRLPVTYDDLAGEEPKDQLNLMF